MQKALRKQNNNKYVGKVFSISKLANERDFETMLRGFERSRRTGKYGAYRQCRERSIFEYRVDLNAFFENLKAQGFTNWNEVPTEAISDYIDAIDQSTKLGLSSKAHRLRTLRAFSNWIDADPECEGLQSFGKLIPRIKKPADRLSIPEQSVMQSFWNSFKVSGLVWDFRDYVIIGLILDCGMRSGELRFLRPESLKLDANTVIVPEEGKTGSRVVPIHDHTVELLKKWLRMREKHAKSEWLFVNKFGGQLKDTALVQSFRRARARLGVTEELSPHTVRHYFATHYLIGGGSLHNLQVIMGHTSMQTLQIYLHLASQIGHVRVEHKRASPMAGLFGKVLGGPAKTRNVR